MDKKYLIQVVFTEMGKKKKKTGYLNYTWLKEMYHLSYGLLSCGYTFNFEEAALDEIMQNKEYIIEDIESINDRKIVSMQIVRVQAEIIERRTIEL